MFDSQLQKLTPKNLTVVEMQQLPDIEKTSSIEEISCLKWDNIKW